jgi:hypothetical protein
MNIYKQKAKELVDKFDEALTYLESKSKAKQCALIAVNEILQIVPSIFLTDDEEIHSGHYQYWQEVKQEIQKL